ncbi:damage-control phosphatase ARMT1 family protein [Streptomyces spiralis]|uniref:damage-control phosphatase ARMT1 family protein n=1 Tax=Streptomyces spiralis TaxID=66376 RepID=UPI00367D49EE
MPEIPTAPVLLGGEPGSFPHSVLAERHPAIIRQVREAFPYGPEQHRALDALLKSCTEGVITPLPADAHDRDRWIAWGLAEYEGRSWFDVPWLWSESYFYRLLLQAVGYFGPGPWQGIDPFRPAKLAELDAQDTDEELAALDALEGVPDAERSAALLHGSLWGNRADLGFRLSAASTDPRATAADATQDAPALVADDSEALWSLLPPSGTGTLCLVADNTGRELVPDLLLVADLLGQGRAAQVVLHVKPYPYYVSDATTADVVDALRRLTAAPGAAHGYGRRLWSAMTEGRLTVRAHPFSCAPLPYAEMPGDLREEFAEATLTVFKGDLNYRRLVGDRLWPPTTSFADVTAYFPGPVAALRTLKSEVVTGLDARTEAALDAAEDRRWRTGGTHALIQVAGA